MLTAFAFATTGVATGFLKYVIIRDVKLGADMFSQHCRIKRSRILQSQAVSHIIVRVLRRQYSLICSFLPTSLITSLLEFALGFYAVIRLITLLTSENFNVPSSISSIRDIRIIQVLAFLFFILVTLVPSAVLTNILGDFIPFSIGSLFVLGLFLPAVGYNTC